MALRARNRRQSAIACGALCSPIRPDRYAAHFQFRIANYQHLSSAYGGATADAVVSAVCSHLVQVVRGAGSVERVAAELIEIRLVSLPAFDAESDGLACQAWVDGVCGILPTVPFETGAGPVHLWLSGCWRLAIDGAEFGEWCFPFAGAPPGEGDWCVQYRGDMALASRTLATLDPSGIGDADGNVQLCWQVVCNAEDGRIAYFEALARPSDRHGAFPAADDWILALERTGMVRLFDRHMVRQVLADLEQAPDDVSLAVNLSALSLCTDPWWADVMERLCARPNVARRLLLEITETAAVPDFSRAIALVNRLRRLGCRIVMDDFGVGHASIRQLLAFAPDIVKVDRIFVWRAGMSSRDQLLFARLSALAASVGSIVVAEGVETPEQSRIARDAGALWQQGYFWGRPFYSRPWKEVRRHSSTVPDRPIGRYRPVGSRLAVGR
ncbi:EAL domain-containing protein [Sphingomonas sp. CFBP8993]|uniref:EAL domain-containing protein n=1 Tax=Sphingomonas sp. CFBP8993 TaxID=3096526 RepID=UPI002A6B08FD|nr:EAL domain-containing protein [Sphingomonas sp. CFBP8993]MDY0958993.1 EAL domain-containing protein [Sphingomonas sp. CFBP8993]